MKVIGIGLNKTGTKTLGHYLSNMGLRHTSFSLELFNHYKSGNLSQVLDFMDDYDSFEDWPWPLIYKEIDEKYEDAYFILTKRKSVESWYKSLCKMAVRKGPLVQFEKYIYGSGMPQGRKKEYFEFYNNHNEEVEEYFKDRPGKLLKLCWEKGDNPNKIASFLGLPETTIEPVHINKSRSVYSGDNLMIAQIYRIVYQTARKIYITWVRLLSAKS